MWDTHEYIHAYTRTHTRIHKISVVHLFWYVKYFVVCWAVGMLGARRSLFTLVYARIVYARGRFFAIPSVKLEPTSSSACRSVGRRSIVSPTRSSPMLTTITVYQLMRCINSPDYWLISRHRTSSRWVSIQAGISPEFIWLR